MDRRRTIITTYAGWTALSALRSGPLRSRNDIYPVLERADFNMILRQDTPEITPSEFADWHRAATERVQKAACSVESFRRVTGSNVT